MPLENPDEYLKNELEPDLFAKYKEGLLGRKRKGFCDSCIAVCKKRSGDVFYPSCTRSSDELADALTKGLNKKEAALLRGTIDCVDWARQELKWHARWYQAMVLRCQSSKIALRQGRRCLAKGTLVMTSVGPRPIETLQVGATVYDEFGKPTKVLDVLDQGPQEVVDLQRYGNKIATCTPEHVWLAYTPYSNRLSEKATKDFGRDELIARQEVDCPLGSVREPTSYVLGAFIGDGCCRDSGLTISSADEPVVKKVASILGTSYKRSHPNNYTWRITGSPKDKIPYYREWCNKKYAHEKFVDLDTIKSWDRETLLEFMAGLFDTDGSVSVTTKEIIIAFGMQSKSAVESFQYGLLALWGVEAKLRIDARPRYKNGPLHTLSVKNIYHCKRILKELTPHLQVDRKKYVAAFDLLVPHNLNPKGLGFGGHKNVRNSRLEHCYDITVASPRNLYLLANGLVTHNSGKTAALAVKALHLAATKPDVKANEPYIVLIIAPYEAQLDKFFEYLRQLIATSVSFKPIQDKQDPQTLEFANNSKITGYTAGFKTGARSDKIRGQGANCLVVGTLVNISEFSAVPIEVLTLQHSVLGGDQSGFYVGNVEGLIKTPNQNIISVSTALTTISCTPDHPLFDGQYDVPADKAQYVITSLAHQELAFSREYIKARLAGYCIGDGWLTSDESAIGISGGKYDLEQIVEDLVLLGDSRHQIYTRQTENPELGIKGETSQIVSRWSVGLLKDSMPAGKKVYQPLHVPDWIKNGKRGVKASWLSGLMSAEGTGINPIKRQPYSRRGPALKMLSSNKEWLMIWFEEIRQLFTDLDIQTSDISIKPKEWKEERWTGEIVVSAKRANLDRYAQTIGFCYSVKKRISVNSWKLHRHYLQIRGRSSWIKNREIRGEVGSAREVSIRLGIPKSTVKYHRKLYHPLYSEEHVHTLEEVIDFYRWRDHYVKLPLIQSAKKSMGTDTVYNLQSSAANRFMAAGIMTHNCLVVDEAEFLRDEDLDSIFAIFASYDKCKLYMSSTPTGLPSKFRNACENPKWRFKEFWFASHEAPTYSKETDEFFKQAMGRIEYEHEILATFGTVSGGVFLPDVLQACIKNYQYNQVLGPDEYAIVGVDCNDKATGTHAVVLGVKAIEKQTYFRVLEKVVLKGTEFSYTKSKEMLLGLHRKWGAILISLDKGFATSQIESLLEHAIQHPETNLSQAIKFYDLGSSYKYTDPLSGTEHVRPYKALMVGLSQRAVQEGRLSIPVIEDNEIGIVGQMRKFKVDKVTRTNQPIYSQGNDHDLTALMLGIMAWVLEISGFDPIITSDRIVTQSTSEVPDDLPLPVLKSARGLGKSSVNKRATMDDEPGGRPRRITSPWQQTRRTPRIPTQRKMF